MAGEYYKTKQSVEEYIHAAKGFSGKELIAKLKEFLPHNSTLLEIGSGPGTDWEILSQSYEVIGSDNSLEFLEHLMNKNPQGEFLELDAVTLRTSRKFNGIYSNKVLHHLTNDELIDSAKRQYDLLNPGGVICHSFWKGEDSEVFKGLFVNYHSEEDLTKIFGNYFKMLSIQKYQEFEKADSILVIGKKK
jgi:trans-aconitate methyltransferase